MSFGREAQRASFAQTDQYVGIRERRQTSSSPGRAPTSPSRRAPSPERVRQDLRMELSNAYREKDNSNTVGAIRTFLDHLDLDDITSVKSRLHKSGKKVYHVVEERVAAATGEPIELHRILQRLMTTRTRPSSPSRLAKGAKSPSMANLLGGGGGGKSVQEDLLHRIFVYYCSFGDQLNSRSMSSAKWLKFARECKLITNRTTSADMDLLFVKVTKSQRTATATMDFDMFTTAIMEVGIRLKFDLTRIPRNEIRRDSEQEAAQLVLEKHIYPNASRVARQSQFPEFMQPEVISELQKHAHLLHQIFKFYAEDDSANSLLLSEERFYLFCKNFEVFPSLLAKSQAKKIFHGCVSLSHNDANRSEASFAEFIDILGRCAVTIFGRNSRRATTLVKAGSSSMLSLDVGNNASAETPGSGGGSLRESSHGRLVDSPPFSLDDGRSPSIRSSSQLGHHDEALGVSGRDMLKNQHITAHQQRIMDRNSALVDDIKSFEDEMEHSIATTEVMKSKLRHVEQSIKNLKHLFSKGHEAENPANQNIVAQLEMTNEHLDQAYGLAQAGTEVFEKQLSQLGSAADRIRLSANDLVSTVTRGGRGVDSSVRVEQLETTLDQTQSEVEALRSTVRRLEETNGQLEERLMDVSNGFRNSQNEIDRLVSEKEFLVTEGQTLSERINQLSVANNNDTVPTSDYNRLLGERNSLAEQCRTLESVLRSLDGVAETGSSPRLARNRSGDSLGGRAGVGSNQYYGGGSTDSPKFDSVGGARQEERPLDVQSERYFTPNMSKAPSVVSEVTDYRSTMGDGNAGVSAAASLGANSSRVDSERFEKHMHSIQDDLEHQINRLLQQQRSARENA